MVQRGYGGEESFEKLEREIRDNSRHGKLLAKLEQWECTRHGDAIVQPSQLEHGVCVWKERTLEKGDGSRLIRP